MSPLNNLPGVLFRAGLADAGIVRAQSFQTHQEATRADHDGRPRAPRPRRPH